MFRIAISTQNRSIIRPNAGFATDFLPEQRCTGPVESLNWDLRIRCAR
jgi:hypothetical protein